MSDWSQGYSTNTDYTYGFFRELSPSYLKLICRLQGVAEPQGELTCLELGCGQGLGPNLLAASNPDDHFIGVDFAPSHIAGARRLAFQARIANVSFIDDSFEQLASQPERLPDCDIITLHGIYSWIGPAQREAIRAIIRNKLKAGGLVYISYNCAAGWSAVASFQQIFRDLAQSRGGGLPQTAAALKSLQAFKAAGFGFFGNNPMMDAQLEAVLKQNLNYIDHEYMNAYWTPFHFQQIARDMRECKLTFVGSGNTVDNSESLSFTPAVAALVNQENDPDIRESLKDLQCYRRFRKDVFVKGAIRLSAPEREQVLRDTKFALVKPRADIGTKVSVPRGELTLGKAAYAIVLDRLERGPASLGDIVPSSRDLHDVVTNLLHLGAIHPVSQAQNTDPETTRRVNTAMTESPHRLLNHGYLASPVLGTAVGINRRLAPMLAAVLHGAFGVSDLATGIAQLHADARYANFFRDEARDATQPPTDERDFRSYLPIWRSLGLLQ